MRQSADNKPIKCRPIFIHSSTGAIKNANVFMSSNAELLKSSSVITLNIEYSVRSSAKG